MDIITTTYNYTSKTKMPSFLCFICHSTVSSDNNDEIRERYREVTGMHLCIDSHLCHICCHVLNRLWLFRAVCLKRSLEYPVLFSEKGTINLQRNELEIQTVCSEDICGQFHSRNVNSKTYTFSYEYDDVSSHEGVDNQYVELMDDRNEEYIIKEETSEGESDTHEIENSPYPEEQDEILLPNAEDHFDNFESATDIYENQTKDGGTVIKTEVNDPTTEIKKLESTTENNETEVKNKKSKKEKKRPFEKIILTLEEQKKELEGRRKEKKYLEAEFKCYNCALGFLFKDSYQTHMMRHEESNGEYRCSICKLRFASGAVLRAHAAAHAERYACARCGGRVGGRGRGTHARRCGGRGGAVTARAACHLCGRVFQDSAGLQQHLKRFHQLGTSNRTYICSACGNSYNNQAALRTHMIKHVNRKFTCEVCGAQYGSPYTLNQHKKKHTAAPAQQHHCVTCDVSYTTRKSLLAHIRTSLKHQQSLLECPICGRAAPNRRSLALHMESLHSGSKNYACPHCAARHTNRKSLVRHIGTHEGKGHVKKAVCHLCGASFKGNNKLNRHLKEVCEKAKLEEEFAVLYEQGCLNPG